MRKAQRVGFMALVATGLGGCGSEDVTTPGESAGIATTISAASATSLSGFAGEPLFVLPSVVVRDQRGQPLSGAPVTFSVQSGGGSMVNASAVTGPAGVATVGGWTLGINEGTDTLAATVVGLPPVTFAASAGVRSVIISGLPSTLSVGTAGETARLQPSITNQVGGSVSGITLSWESADPFFATVSPDGVVQGLILGLTRVRLSAVRAGTVMATRIVTVQVVPSAPGCRVPMIVARGSVGPMPSWDPVYRSMTGIPMGSGRSYALDYDGDGDEDILRLDDAFGGPVFMGTTRAFRNDAGSFVDQSGTISGPIVPQHPRDFEMRDFTGDGAIDLYVAQHGYDAPPFPGAPNLLLTRHGGVLAQRAPTAFTPYSTVSFTHGATAGDVDCDGDEDIVELNSSRNAPNMLYLNSGSGQFVAAEATQFPVGISTSWSDGSLLDYDRDGDLDLYLGGSGTDADAWLINDGTGRFTKSAATITPAPHFSPNHFTNGTKGADFDGDGWSDLLVFEVPVSFASTSRIRLWINQRNGTFLDRSVAWGLPALCGGEVGEPFVVRDVNGDGWPDVMFPGGCPELGQGGLLINRGTSFTSVPYTSVASFLTGGRMLPLDVDGDFRIDLTFPQNGNAGIWFPQR